MGYQRCTRCVMDNASDPTIRFDSEGVCNYCSDAYSKIGSVYYPNEEGERSCYLMLNKVVGIKSMIASWECQADLIRLTWRTWDTDGDCECLQCI